jgi:hypothetical protein
MLAGDAHGRPVMASCHLQPAGGPGVGAALPTSPGHAKSAACGGWADSVPLAPLPAFTLAAAAHGRVPAPVPRDARPAPLGSPDLPRAPRAPLV